MNLRFRRRSRALEKIEVTALIGLGDVLLVQRAIAALEARWRHFPLGAAAGEAGVPDLQLQTAFGDIKLDDVAVAHKSQWPAGERFRRDMQHAGAVACPAYSRVGDAQHVSRSLSENLFRDRQLTPFGHARCS